MALPKIERALGNPFHPFRFGETTGSCDIREWCQTQKVSDVVRFTPAELQFAISAKYLTHFNLQQSGFITHSYYAGVEICQNGRFDGQSEVNPVLRLDQWLKLLCLKTRNHVLYKDLKPEDLMDNDLATATPEALLKAIWNKYHPVLPNLTHRDFVQAGLCITRFQILDRISAGPPNI